MRLGSIYIFSILFLCDTNTLSQIMCSVTCLSPDLQALWVIDDDDDAECLYQKLYNIEPVHMASMLIL